MRTYQLTIGQAEAGMRLDHYLVRRLPESMSRSMIQRAIKEGRVRLRDEPVKPNQKLHLGDVISATFAELGAKSGDLALPAQDIPVEAIYEDDWVLVVNKPAGLVTHPAPGHWDGTLVNAVLWHLGQHQSPSTKHQGLPRAGIVHRLDKDTSGLLLVAKTEEAHIALSRQLKARAIHRRYVALAEGHLPLNQGTVNVPIGRHAIHRKEMAIKRLGGKPAVTHYRVIRRLQNEFRWTLLEVTLDTGRTHQIRVHLAHLGHPVVGDVTYGNHPASYWQPLGVGRQLLHAAALTFNHPATQREIGLTASIPEDMAKWLSPQVLEMASKRLTGVV